MDQSQSHTIPDVNPVGLYPVSVIAQWFLSRSAMDHRKLQKLCYYAEAWYIVFNNRKLISDCSFEAWVHGPVSPPMYNHFKQYGYIEIPQSPVTPDLDRNVSALLEWVYSAYGQMDGFALSDLTHKEEPWIEAREGKAPLEIGTNKLNLHTIRRYYTDLLASLIPEA